MEEAKALEIISHAMKKHLGDHFPIANESRYHEFCYRELIKQYDSDGFRHMTDIIIEHIANDSRCIFGISVHPKYMA